MRVCMPGFDNTTKMLLSTLHFLKKNLNFELRFSYMFEIWTVFGEVGVGLPFMVTHACQLSRNVTWPKRIVSCVNNKARSCRSCLNYTRLRRIFPFAEEKKCLGTLNEGE